ncbi:hypothetical protein ACFYTQ_24335 [Nocardia sp. NPDC004068]|uniref:hypothetical protein n=1 Tax=Nocardia sp. NPDC004068 TaxID=3364303 RepID=UPI0036A8A09C
MVEQREVIRPGQVQAVVVVETDAAGAISARTARGQDQTVPDDAAQGVARAAGDGRGDEVVIGALEQRDLANRPAAQRVRVDPVPVLIDQ